MKNRNKKIVYILIGIAAVILVTIGITYAYWLITKNQTRENLITSACLDITISNEENDITLTNQFPLSDEDGMKLTPYTLTVTNNCNTSVDYHINLESIGTESEAVISSAIKAMLDENTPQVISDYSEKDVTVEGAYEARLLGSGTLSAKDTEGSSASHSLRLWIDEDAPISEMNKSFRSKLSVTIGQGIVAGSSLATLIMNDAQTNNYLYSTTPDFSQITEDGEYGLYTAQDDYGTSYYFRGDVENNYVKFGPEVYVSTYLPKDVDLTAICGEDADCIALLGFVASMVFQTQESCEIRGQTIGVWETCEESEIETVYTPMMDTMEVHLLSQTSIGYKTADDCNAYLTKYGLADSGFVCTEKTINKATLKKYEQLTWRIVRVNGDNSIRLVYDGLSAIANSDNHIAAIGDSAYNLEYNNAKYVGYTYDDGSGNQVDSTIKGLLDTWYTENLEADYGKYMADSIYCNDREITSTSGSYKYYAPYTRLYTNKSPILTCTNQSDRYTVEDTELGNGLLTKPIGLMTADEIAMASGVYNEFSLNNYLYSSSVYWTSSPFRFNGSNAYVFSGVLGTLGSNSVHYTDADGVRPVINLKANTLFTGSGTVKDPYRLAS